MNDYIKRRDAIEALCDICEALLKQSGAGEVAKARRGKCPIIKAIPAADVVEVVRCKDCEHHEELLYNNDGKVLCWVHGLDVVVDGNGYCSYGERKEQDHE